jgi:hypothetical protein
VKRERRNDVTRSDRERENDVTRCDRERKNDVISVIETGNPTHLDVCTFQGGYYRVYRRVRLDSV